VAVVILARSRPANAALPGIAEQSGIRVDAIVHDLDSALLQVERTTPTVLVVSATMGEMVGHLCRRLRLFASRPRVLLIDGDEDVATLLWAVEAGVDGYLAGPASAGTTAACIRALARGEAVVPPAMLGPLLRELSGRRREASRAAERFVELTRREREVLALMAAGDHPSQIAADLVISPETVRTHIERILRKLRVHSRAEAVSLVTGLGIMAVGGGRGVSP
jgi:DNA-binding NarL/FixJ family response regulator